MTKSHQTPDHDPDFTPPFCPNHHCPFHLESASRWLWHRNGFYVRKSDGARFQAFRCLECRRGFSTRTFCTDYWLRKRDLLPRVAGLSVGGAGLRQSARFLGVAHATIGRHLARIGRHSLLFHRKQIRDLKITEPVAADGFESFEYSQFHPFHLNLAAGTNSWFLYDFTESPLRRKGRMTPAQKRRRQVLETTLGRPDPKSVETGMKRLLQSLLSHVPAGECLEIESDEHPAYPRALKRLRRESPELPAVTHRVTSSKAARTMGNPLFAINLADLLLRHCHAGHRRETIAYSKRLQGAIERAAGFVVWRNYIKRRRENGDETTAAMVLGLLKRPLRWADVFRRRLFPHRVGLEDWRWNYYRRTVKTLALGDRQSEHRLRRAF